MTLAGWQPTRDLLHDYVKLIGAVRAAFTRPQRHWGHVSLFVSARGLTTSPIPADSRAFELILDLGRHRLIVETSLGEQAYFPLHGQSAQRLSRELLNILADLDITPELDPDLIGRSAGVYDLAAVGRFWQAVSQLDLLLKQFGGELRHGAGAVRFWPHHFDLAMLWLTGRCMPGTDPENEDYADERMNFGFSTGDDTIPEPYLYATAYPLPPELARAALPAGARWHAAGWQGAVLPWGDLSETDNVEARVLEFLRGMQELGLRHMTPGEGC